MFGAFTCLVNFWHSQCDLRLSTSIKKKFHLWWIHIAGPLQFCTTLVGYLPGSKFYVSEKTIPQAFTQHCHNGLESRAGELWGEYRGGSRQTPHPSICIIITAVNWSPGRGELRGWADVSWVTLIPQVALLRSGNSLLSSSRWVKETVSTESSRESRDSS